MSACPHVADVRPPRPDHIVHREECTQCFDTHGINVCLTCFNGACCDDHDPTHHNHQSLHYERTRHPLILNIRRTPKVRKDESEERPKKLTKLEILAEEPESERFDFNMRVHCLDCNVDVPSDEGNLSIVIPAILSAQTMAKQSDIQAFSFDLQPCEHVLLLPDPESPHPHDLSQCAACDLKANLWLCLTCGNTACGRTQYGGQGLPGNGHALAHHLATAHPIAVKLGSITAEGNADVFCYVDDQEIVDPMLGQHLAVWGIDLAGIVVTEKSLAEMQLDLQYKYSFNMSSADGAPLQAVFGPGLTGFVNLGNSCYVSSVIQALFSIPEWQTRYSVAFETHPHECPIPYEGTGKGSCLECQMAKVCNGLVSGRYSIKQVTVHPDGSTEEYQNGISPRMFKSLIGQGHAEFAGTKQQDAQEFLIWLISRVQRMGKPTGAVAERLALEESAHTTKAVEHGGDTWMGEGGDIGLGWGGVVDPTFIFRFVLQTRIQCLGCGGVKYRVEQVDNINIAVPDRLKALPSRLSDAVEHTDPTATENAANSTADTNTASEAEYEPVEFEDCIKTFCAKTEIDLVCSYCEHPRATMANGFLTLPDVLVVTANRFLLKNWVPTKVEVPLIVPETPINFSRYLVPRGVQPGEHPLPDETASGSTPSLPPLNESASQQIQEMGFSAVQAEKALRMTGNTSAEAAMQWLFEHIDDEDLNVPFQTPGQGAGGAVAEVDQGKMEDLMGMGFDEHMAKRALQETAGNMERAVDWLFSHPLEPPPVAELDAYDSNANAVSIPPTSTEKLTGYSTPASYALQSVVMHKGSSIHAGHYVAFIRKKIPGAEKEDWILFNDEKVVRGGDWNEVYTTGYVYFFRRV